MVAVPSHVQNQLKALPAKPGVYLFRDAQGDVLYVGKAKSLRPRVRSYFQQSLDTRATIRELPERVDAIEVIVTQNEVEALHLEQNLIKRHRPPFNVRLRDDKSFPYIAVTVEDDYPRVMFTRERHRRGVVYFGPYANAKKVRETLDVLNRVFRYRPCEGPQPGRHSGIPCLDYHIERCFAPCVGYISKEEYRDLIDQVIEFLSGEDRPIRRRLEQQMREAAAEERFEDAARYRNRLRAIERLSERQAVERKSIGTIDVIGVAVSPERAAVQVFPLRDGRMVDRYAFHLENAGGEELVEALEELREALNLESLPIRIECFDISNLQGHEVVGSMVVFEDAVAKRGHYRKFTLRGVDGQDDFASMREVITRRFSRLGADPGSEEWNESFAAAPNLVVIDGGKGQLSAALAAMQELDLPRVAVIALAKRIEEVFVPGRSEPILLPVHSPGLQLLQRIRDEAHRFAVTFHRQRRDASARESMFDQIEGVAPARRRALLRHFGSAERVLRASAEEPQGVPGAAAKTARMIYAQLHKTGRA